MQNNHVLQALMLTSFLALSPVAFSQTLTATVPMNEVMSKQDQEILAQNALAQVTVESDDCEMKFPFPLTAKRDPYAENGAEVCAKLKIRGQRMQCEVESLVQEKPASRSTTGAKIEMAAWARCNSKVANLLVEGYYLPASEIERRLQICSSNFYADPGGMPKQGWYQRFLRWATSNDLTPPPTNASLEVVLRQSTPLESHQDAAGLMKCEWMFSRSRSPVIDVLPGGSDMDVRPLAPVTPAKKPAPKRTAPAVPKTPS